MPLLLSSYNGSVASARGDMKYKDIIDQLKNALVNFVILKSFLVLLFNQ